MKYIKHFGKSLLRLIDNKQFFYLIAGFLVIQAAWIALSGRYPMAFDEDFHLGIIRLYAHHISPFWSHQPAGGDAYGALARDPSYLYQYLMSFPYRLISVFTNSQTVQVLILRAINIALFTWGLFIFKKVLLKTGASLRLVNITCLIFILLPVVSLLAAQINYDNLFFPVTGLTLLLAFRFSDELKKKRFNLSLFTSLICLMLLGSLVKYAFLPIAVIVSGFIIFRLVKTFGISKELIKEIHGGWKKHSVKLRIIIVAGLLISLTLFGQRYAVNLIKYHTPTPECDKVLSIKECSAYGPWIRDYDFKINRIDTEIGTEKGIVTFGADWFYGMWLRIFFTVDGPGTLYQTRGPLPVPSLSAVVFVAIGIVAVLISFKRLLRQYEASNIVLLALLSVIYIVTLWLDEFKSFLDTRQPVAINGRYLIPILLPIILMMVMSVSIILKNHIRIKVATMVVVIFSLFWGGGALTYILRSNDAWYWHNQIVYDANHAVQHVLGPLTPRYNQPAEFLK